MIRGGFFMYEEKEPKAKKQTTKVKHEKKFFHKINKKDEKVKETTPKKEKKTKKILSFKADYVSVLVRFAMFLLVGFVVIFIVTKIRNGSDARTFTNNMEEMKEVAEVYYKVDTHRPLSVNEEVMMTLGDMEDASLIKELKDKDDNICSKEYSYVSLEKQSAKNYELTVYLSCGGESEMATYPLIYETENTDGILYELTRTITKDEKYSCPEGYLLSGRYCIRYDSAKTEAAKPVYRVIPEKNTAARYKPSGYEYEYVDPIITETANVYDCPSGYTLNGTVCIKEGTVKYRTQTDYTCPNGATPSGSRCLYTTRASYSDEKPYCKRGTLLGNDTCYVTKEYSVRCVTGRKDSTLNACYTTYSASQELSDWLFDGKVTYSDSYDISRLENEKRMYEVDEYLDNGRIRYNRYIRKYIKVCDDGDELSGSTCRHYDDAYETRYCPSDYHLSSDQSECYTYEDAYYRETTGTYTCPEGYSKRGSGSNTSCYKYEKATAHENKTPYCSSSYDLTSDNKCIRSVTATLKEDDALYTCPSGYTKRGSGSNTTCYKKTTTDSYYYCSSSNATLEGTRCITKGSTTFRGYSCPIGYDNVGRSCVKTNVTERILAEETNGSSTETETIWSKEKDLEGWTWTGNTKEAE